MSLTRLLPVVLLVLVPAASRAQASTADQLQRAIEMYRGFNVEGARPILQNIVSPNYLLTVTPAQKVTAYKYLGASYAVLGHADTAAIYFTAALDFDPFTTLDPREFSASEQAAFTRAKQNIFKLAIRPVSPTILDSTYAFQIIVSHRAAVTVTLIDTRDTLIRENLFQQEDDGIQPRAIRWQGLMRNGQRADSSLYELRVEGRSLLNTSAGSVVVDRQLFRIEHVFPPLEDTLPDFAPNELLIQEYKPSAHWLDLIKGGALAAAAVTIPLVALNDDVPWKGHAAIAASAAAAAGGITFQFRRTNRSIPANVAENERRRAQRNEFNAGVRARNQQRINQTVLLICPQSGCPR